MVNYKCIVRAEGYSYYSAQNTIRSNFTFIMRSPASARTRELVNQGLDSYEKNVAIIRYPKGKKVTIEYMQELPKKVVDVIESFAADCV